MKVGHISRSHFTAPMSSCCKRCKACLCVDEEGAESDKTLCLLIYNARTILCIVLSQHWNSSCAASPTLLVVVRLEFHNVTQVTLLRLNDFFTYLTSPSHKIRFLTFLCALCWPPPLRVMTRRRNEEDEEEEKVKQIRRFEVYC